MVIGAGLILDPRAESARWRRCAIHRQAVEWRSELVALLRAAQLRVAHPRVVGEAARETEAPLSRARDAHGRGGAEAPLANLALLPVFALAADRLGLGLGRQRRALLA